MNLINEGLRILTDRKLKFVSRFIPYFLASYGAHHFNLYNRRTGVYKTFGRVPDMRMQILFSAPPGWSKSMFLKQLLHRTFGIVNTGSVPVRFIGSCTEAAWTGSSNGVGVNMVPSVGIAEEYRNGIVGMEEFAALSALMETQHSAHLEQSLALSLFEGDVVKDLKSTKIDFHTDITVWAGNQIMNFDLSGGLFRRFFHIFWAPRLDDADELKRAAWEGDNVDLNDAQLMNYRMELARMSDNINNIRRVTFSDKFKTILYAAPHFEMNLYKSFGVGYTLMGNSNVPSELIIDPDDDMIDYISNAMLWRKQLLADPQGYQVEALLYDLEADKEPVKWSDVREYNLLFSVSNEETDNILRRLIISGRVKYDSGGKSVRLA